MATGNDKAWNLNTHLDYVKQRTHSHSEWHWASEIWQQGDNSVMFFQENPSLACCKFGIRNDFSGKPELPQPAPLLSKETGGFLGMILKQIAENDPYYPPEDLRRTPSPLSSSSSGYHGSRLSSESSNRMSSPSPPPSTPPMPLMMDEAAQASPEIEPIQ